MGNFAGFGTPVVSGQKRSFADAGSTGLNPINSLDWSWLTYGTDREPAQSSQIVSLVLISLTSSYEFVTSSCDHTPVADLAREVTPFFSTLNQFIGMYVVSPISVFALSADVLNAPGCSGRSLCTAGSGIRTPGIPATCVRLLSEETSVLLTYMHQALITTGIFDRFGGAYNVVRSRLLP
jgi:hypothetical protein